MSDIGLRVVLTAPDCERTYATVVGPGSQPESVLLNVDGRYYNPQEHWRKHVKSALAVRDTVIGDLLNLDVLKAVFEVEFIGTLWTKGDSGPMTPYVCECSFGDGLQLIKISTINQRPNYHLVRVDSGWSESNWSSAAHIGEHMDDILQAIEEECGLAGECLDEPCLDCGHTFCKCGESYCADKQFPALDDRDGCSWAKVSWSELIRGFGCQ